MAVYNIPGVRAFDNARIFPLENISFGSNVIIDDFAFIYARGRITIGNHVHIASFASLAGGAEITIDDFVAISHGARLLSASDDFVGWGFGNSTVPEEYRNTTRAPINIGRFCIVGANTVVLPGVSVGEGTTVGANSVVTRDLEPWGVYIGNKRIKERDREGVLRTYRKFCDDHPEYPGSGE